MLKPVIYSDDTTLFAVIEAFGNDKDELERNISNELRIMVRLFVTAGFPGILLLFL